MPDLQPWQWALGALCAMFVGVAKTGMPGFGISAIPLMVFAVGNARASAGWLLPILCVADRSTERASAQVRSMYRATSLGREPQYADRPFHTDGRSSSPGTT